MQGEAAAAQEPNLDEPQVVQAPGLAPPAAAPAPAGAANPGVGAENNNPPAAAAEAEVEPEGMS